MEMETEEVIEGCVACGNKDLEEGFVSTVLVVNIPYFNMSVPLMLCKKCKLLNVMELSKKIIERIEG